MNENLIIALRDYCQNTLNGKCQEGTGVLSALINTIDTIREGELLLPSRQVDREVVIVDFLCSHDVDNVYKV